MQDPDDELTNALWCMDLDQAAMIALKERQEGWEQHLTVFCYAIETRLRANLRQKYGWHDESAQSEEAIQAAIQPLKTKPIAANYSPIKTFRTAFIKPPTVAPDITRNAVAARRRSQAPQSYQHNDDYGNEFGDYQKTAYYETPANTEDAQSQRSTRPFHIEDILRALQADVTIDLDTCKLERKGALLIFIGIQLYRRIQWHGKIAQKIITKFQEHNLLASDWRLRLDELHRLSDAEHDDIIATYEQHTHDDHGHRKTTKGAEYEFHQHLKYLRTRCFVPMGKQTYMHFILPDIDVWMIKIAKQKKIPSTICRKNACSNICNIRSAISSAQPQTTTTN